MSGLSLTIDADSFKNFIKQRNSAAYQRLSDAALKRDHRSCVYCGYQAKKGLQVVSTVANYEQPELGDLVSVCNLCVQCFFIGTQSSGQIIHLPEFSQAELHAWTRALFVALKTAGSRAELAKVQYQALRNRAKPIEEIFGPGTSDARVFGQLFIDANLVQQDLGPIVKSLRFFPYRKNYPKSIAVWQEQYDLTWSQA